MHTETAITLTFLVLAYAVVSGLVHRWYVAPALIFVVCGIALGPSGAGWIDVKNDDSESFTVLAQLALTVILFNQASRLNLSTVLRRGRLTLRLLAIGIPASIALGTLAAVALLPVLPLWEAVCLAVIVAPTEVALLSAVLDDTRIPERVRNALSAESGFYDGFALAALLAALAVASEDRDPEPARWAWFVFRTEFVSLGVGLAIGALGAFVIVRSSNRQWMSATWAQLSTVALALACFVTAERLHASGFVAAFAGGLAFTMVSARLGGQEATTQVSDAIGELLELLVFAMFGAFAVIDGFRHAGWRVVVFALVALFVVRMAAVLLSMVRANLPLSSTLFMGWFGPRGIGTMVLGLIVVDRGDIAHRGLIEETVVIVVTLSLVLHSLTAPLSVRFAAKSAQE
ncbi:MAG: sodium/hydrogen antiporter [Mycobacterium sp.]|jgi:NhaP-type Na+/H+ or K+/H+ antiporter|nr:sodium/hydrogen antiporter [Mycobacterium sp.]